MANAAPPNTSAHASKASKITLTFPDGATRQVESGTTGLAVAKSISPSLAKRTVAMSLDGNLADLADPITADAAIKFVARTDPEALPMIRHDAAHVMAEAVQSLWPKVAGDDRPRDRGRLLLRLRQAGAVPPRRSRQDREANGRDHRQERALHQGGLEPQEGARSSSASAARTSRSSSSTPSPRTRTSRSTSRASGSISAAARTWSRPARSARRSSCRRSPAHIGAAIPTGRCCSGSTARRGRAKTSSRPTCTGWRRPRSATTASSAARWTSSISRRRRRAPSFGTPRAGRSFRRSSPTCAGACPRPATRR